MLADLIKKIDERAGELYEGDDVVQRQLALAHALMELVDDEEFKAVLGTACEALGLVSQAVEKAEKHDEAVALLHQAADAINKAFPRGA